MKDRKILEEELDACDDFLNSLQNLLASLEFCRCDVRLGQARLDNLAYANRESRNGGGINIEYFRGCLDSLINNHIALATETVSTLITQAGQTREEKFSEMIKASELRM